jgi:hypothetical protein
VRAKAIMRSAFVALVSLMFSEKNVDVECVHVLCLITRDVLLSCSRKHMLLTFQEGYSRCPKGALYFARHSGCAV